MQPPATTQAVVPKSTAVATTANSGPLSGVANVGIRRAEIKHGRDVEGCGKWRVREEEERERKEEGEEELNDDFV